MHRFFSNEFTTQFSCTCQYNDVRKDERKNRPYYSSPYFFGYFVDELSVEEKILVKNERCLADELQEALLKTESDVDDDVFLPSDSVATKQTSENTKIYPKFSGRYLQELKTLQFTNSVSKNTKPFLNSNNIYLEEDSTTVETRHLSVASSSGRDGRESDGKIDVYRGGYGVLRHFQQYFCYIVAVSFSGGGNRRTQRKPTTKSLTNFMT